MGRWNPAILTPKGIAQHIFSREGEFPIEVMVPLDAQGPPKVRIDGLSVLANFERLVIECEDSWVSLESAREYCCKAIDALPLTPLTAAGFNLRFKLSDPESPFVDSLVLPIDDKISENHLTIKGREIHRSVKWENGLINIQISRIQADVYNILLNFDKKSSNSEDLKSWLSTSIEDVKTIATKILCSILEVCEEGDLECLIQQGQ